MTTSIRNPYLEGNFAPVSDEVSVDDLPLTGTLPSELNGRYLRIGPNPTGSDETGSGHHWFVGRGMVHGIRLRDGRAEWYRNRFVHGDVPEDSPNTNILAQGGRLLALVEGGGAPVSIAPDLNRMSTWDVGGALQDGFTAHPKIDPVTGEMHAINYLIRPGADHLRYVVLDATGKATHTAELPVSGVPMVHDMAMTATRVVVLDLPVTLSMDAVGRLEAGAPENGDALPMRWNEEHPSRVGVLPRGGTADQMTWFDAPRCYVFHVLNAYDAPDGSIVMDVVRYDTVFRDSFRGPADGLPALARWTIAPDRGTVSEQIISDRSVEWPRINPQRAGRSHRYGWFGATGPDSLRLSDDVNRDLGGSFEPGPLVKFDTTTGEASTHHFGTGRVTQEPTFVARPGAEAEDDGWILSVVHDGNTDRSELVVLDAADVTAAPVARVRLPRRVPFGFHGNWVADNEIGA
ncbi:carotenoid oxygenase family protein [Streptomyces iconiensis]|uniref:Dioxygenase n=1 Tax=Streptomyces iconiensis TaxID=1384038 RepID=A0ABT6ZYQ2_9ACTN|nr:carotenoid oxygenase family protein [Streptomyces iconiensis]MDJ1134197.1 carotenoid oxygenase family protein [Streptomyces iconiensis]